MGKKYSIPALIFVLVLVGLSKGFSQDSYIPQFLKEKQVWEEKLVVLYAPADKQYLIKDQLNLLHPYINELKRENITVLTLPSQLCEVNRNYLERKMKAQGDRLNIWVLDEKGSLRMVSTKLTSIHQFLRVLDIDRRPHALASTHVLRD